MKLNILIALAATLTHLVPVSGAFITIDNADFEDASNEGSIQGTLLGGGELSDPLGSGPWSAETEGLLVTLLPPTASIEDGVAAISGLLGLGVLGQSNSAVIFQTLEVGFQPEMTYTLSAEVNAGTSLTLNLLGDNGIGIALTAGNAGNPSNIVASSSTAAQLVSLGESNYRLDLSYTTPSVAPTGNIGVRLFAGDNTSLATVNLLGSVMFDNVALSAVPEPNAGVCVIASMAALIVLHRVRRSVRPLHNDLNRP